ncbi:MAG: ATP synthase F1 subunit delta [Candidatus Zixiibacteriota bacterium]|nr:MAG: ATP synthase F1 subunit delta [candidate division Zixibacteria bacterium]
MKDTRVAKRYSHALFNVALGRGTIDIVSSEIFQLKSFSDKDKRFIGFLAAPQVPTEQKVDMVRTLFTTRLSPSLLSFLLLLIEKGRVGYLGEIAREFEKLVEDYKGLIKARVTTAIHIEEEYKERLREKLMSVTNKKVEILHRIDKNIMGGIIVQLNYNIIDKSVKSQLESLKHDLMSLKVY